jgi:LysM repeat protein
VRLVVPPSDQPQPEIPPDDQTTEPEQPAAEPPPPTETPLPPEPTPTPRPNPVIFIDYLVQANDTLYGLTIHHATSIALMAQEDIAQDHLVPGQTIKLPVGNPAYCPGRRPYAVAEGDTAFNISRTLGVSLEDLKSINELNDNFDIKAAQILCVP